MDVEQPAAQCWPSLVDPPCLQGGPPVRSRTGSNRTPGRVQHPPKRSNGDHQSRTRPDLFGGSNGPYSATFNMTAYQQGIVGPFGRRPRGPWFRPRPAGSETETGLVAEEHFEGLIRTGQPELIRPADHLGSVPWVQRTWPVWIVLVPIIAI